MSGKKAIRAAAAWAAVAAGLCVGAVVGGSCTAAEYEPGTPATYLFDSGAPLPATLTATDFAKKAGWKLVAEDNLAHTFTGDAVLLNDKLVIVLRQKMTGADVYAQSPAGLAHRAILAPLAAGPEAVARVDAIKTLENNPGAVMVEAAFKRSDGTSCGLRYRLTAGQAFVETQAAADARQLDIHASSRYIVVPDFFGDDMVFWAAACRANRLELPAENFFLSLLDGGNAMLMCVWPSSHQQAEARVEQGSPGMSISDCRIPFAPGKPIWVGFLEGPGLWHRETLWAHKPKDDVVLSWKPPFAAKWRLDLAQPDGLARSSYFHRAGDADEGAPARAGPCCSGRLEPDRAIVRLPATGEPSSLVIYPIDRSRDTPLTTLCPIDILRNTLGVGPCQYILQTEGLASAANPTPDNVMSWVEKQFARKKEKSQAGEIRDLLQQMTEHMGHVQGRIAQYRALARDLRTLLDDKTVPSVASRDVGGLRRTLDYMEQAISATGAGAPEPRPEAQLAARVAGLIGKPDASAECRQLGQELRRLGAAGDRTMSCCRMAARWLKEQARMMANDSQSAALAQSIERRTQQVLTTN
jgi:hypothetical protein